jgi:hypothetical protein
LQPLHQRTKKKEEPSTDEPENIGARMNHRKTKISEEAYATREESFGGTVRFRNDKRPGMALKDTANSPKTSLIFTISTCR